MDLAKRSYDSLVVDTLHLTKFSDHLNEIILFTLLFHLIYQVSYHASGWSRSFQSLSLARKASWSAHIISQVFACTIVFLVIPCFFDPVLLKDPLFAYTRYSGTLYAYGCGYFLFDIYHCLYEYAYNGPVFVLHGVLSFSVFFFTFGPYMHRFGVLYMFYEVSTVFLNIHWFCDKIGWSDTLFQKVNASIGALAFFVVRLCYGCYISYYFCSAILNEFDKIPAGIAVFYLVANVASNMLNVYWFTKIVSAFSSRLSKSSSAPPSPKKAQ